MMILKLAIVLLLVTACLVKQSASMAINEEVEQEAESQDKLAIHLHTFVDKRGVEMVGDELITNLTLEVTNIVKDIFASVKYNVIIDSFGGLLNVPETTTVLQYLEEFYALARQSNGSIQNKFGQQTFILFKGYQLPVRMNSYAEVCEKPVITGIPLKYVWNNHRRSARDVAYDVVYAIGRNLGLHFDTFGCVCSSDLCLMEIAFAEDLPRDWSDCSKKKLAELRADPPTACMSYSDIKLNVGYKIMVVIGICLIILCVSCVWMRQKGSNSQS